MKSPHYHSIVHNVVALFLLHASLLLQIAQNIRIAQFRWRMEAVELCRNNTFSVHLYFSLYACLLYTMQAANDEYRRESILPDSNS